MSAPDFLARLWSEAKRRRVPQVVGTYIGLAWFTIEATPVILRNLGVAPPAAEAAGSGLTVLWLALFPLALTLTWMYQVVPDTGEPEEPVRSWHRRRLPATLALIVVCGGCAALATTLWPGTPILANPPGRVMDTRALALLPPHVLRGDADTKSVAECIVHRLTDRLSLLPGVEVRSAMAAEEVDSDLPADSAATLLGAGTIVTSSAEGFGDSIRLSFQIVDGVSGVQHEAFSIVEILPVADGTYERLADTLEIELRTRLGQVEASWERSPFSQDPEVVQQRELALDEEAAYGRSARAGDVDGALAALAREDAALERWALRDPGDPYPVGRRSWVAQQRSMLFLTNDYPSAIRALERAWELADAAVLRFPQDGESLRLRGLAALSLVGTDTAVALDRGLWLERADLDLRRAQARHRDRATIRRDLALLKAEQGALADAYAFAGDAYAHDAYLTHAQTLLFNLFDFAFELERDTDAARWCQEGARRFPGRWLFSECRLRLMGWGALPPDTARARELVDTALVSYPPAFRGVLRPQMETLLAAVRVQVGDTAAARGALELTTLATTPAVRLTAAGVWLLLNDEERALAELDRYVAELPGRADRLPRLRMLAPLRGDARFNRMSSRGS